MAAKPCKQCCPPNCCELVGSHSFLENARTPRYLDLHIEGFLSSPGFPCEYFNKDWVLVFRCRTAGIPATTFYWEGEDERVRISISQFSGTTNQFDLTLTVKGSGCQVTYSIAASLFVPFQSNTFTNPIYGFCGACITAPASLTVVPRNIVTGCCLRGDIVYSTQYYLTVMNVNGAQCVAGTYGPLVKQLTPYLGYAQWHFSSGGVGVSLFCDLPGTGFSGFSFGARINGCTLYKIHPTLQLCETNGPEELDSSYNPFVLRFRNIWVVNRPDPTCCATVAQDCIRTNKPMVEAVFTP